MNGELTAEVVVGALQARADPAELPKVRRRLAPDEPAIGIRMRELFDVARWASTLPLGEVERLLDQPTYEARMCAVCVLDLQVRDRLGDPARQQLYLRRHDRITTWDMVDRAAPRVLGGPLLGGPYEVLHELAASADPLRRRSAITAPLLFVRQGSDADLTAGYVVASALAADPEPVVHQAVGTFLKHAGERAPLMLNAFLTSHARTMPRSVVRLALEKADPSVRRRWVG
ncbi:DNA alkylation repair protein [Desertihabitans brevis]|uniref:DNA alkylation repair protein n=1 Tax=Desertihabitans brevis TaxID=2268447 RepID=UPI0018F693A7|nr:DNA alkylation repair protein [Desertihabitans brevis]